MDAVCKGRGINGPIPACGAIDSHWLYNRNQAFWASNDGKTSHPCASLCRAIKTWRRWSEGACVRSLKASLLDGASAGGLKGAVLNVL